MKRCQEMIELFSKNLVVMGILVSKNSSIGLAFIHSFELRSPEHKENFRFRAKYPTK